ncbi:MAG: hypothetical protein IPJ54_03330 [Saprospiraceae bacterium]|nr:hypothetical protein [Saprospiraceae bacterium]
MGCFYSLKHKGNPTPTFETETVVDRFFSHLSTKVFQNHMSTLFAYTESWLAIREMLTKKYESDLLLLEAYNRRGA